MGLAVLTAYGSTTIDRLVDQVYATPDAYVAYIPESLHGRELRDPLVVDALEVWASREAAEIMVGLFIAAALVMAAAILPSLILGGRARMLPEDAADRDAAVDTEIRHPMTTKRPGRKPRAERPTALIPIDRRPATAVPGRVRIFAQVDGEMQSFEGADALEQLPGLLNHPDASVWVDLAGPTREQVESVGAALALHPLIIEDVLEGNQRAKIETTDGVVHIVLFHLAYDDEFVASRGGHRARLGYLLTVHGAVMTRDSMHLRRGPSTSWPTGRTTCCGRSPTTSSTATSRSPTGSATPSTRSRTTSSRKAPPGPRAPVRPQARAHRVRRAVSPDREVFNQLTNRETRSSTRTRSSTSATSTTTSSA